MRAAGHYLFTVAMLAVYGGQVCPFVDGLSVVYWSALLGGLFLALFALRGPLVTRTVEGAPLEGQVARQFKVELALFAGAGIFIMAYNTVIHGFPPLESGVKFVLGTSMFGFFTAADMALARERELHHTLREQGRSLDPREGGFPLTRKITLVAGITLVLVTMVSFLVITRDFLWLQTVGAEKVMEARRSILIEFVFIGLVALAETLNLIRSFSANLRLFFDAQNGALARVHEGMLDSRVTVSTRDEFGVMGATTNWMIDRLRQRTEELAVTRDVTILSMATLAETRDNETGAHIVRTQEYVRALAVELLRADPERYGEALTGEAIGLIHKSAPLHDIGKVGIPDAILLKPGKLTDEEFAFMKLHATFGYEAIVKAEEALGESSFLRHAREIAHAHHEKWDGSGYPQGLDGEAIPLSARIMAVADVYDALISRRVYKPPFPHEKARAIILEGRGGHFDPAVVDAFAAIEEQIRAIATAHGDEYTK